MKRRECLTKEELFRELEISGFYSLDRYYETASEVYKHHNEIVLEMDKAVRLIGLMSDEDDTYYVFKNLHGDKIWSSCVGSFVPLKGTLSDEDYWYLEQLFVRNDKNIERLDSPEAREEFKKHFEIV